MKLTRQFWFGILLGLSIGSALRQANAGGFSQAGIRRIYRLWAPNYKLANVYFLGQLPRMRQLAIERLQLEPGGSVLDLSCGTGANFPYLEEQIGPSGRLVGVDYTQSMLNEARRLIVQRGWQNVELVYTDAATLDLKEEFDGVLWTLAPSIVPGWQVVLDRAVSHLRPGGWLVVADARFSERWYARPFNWYADLLSLSATADIGRRPWELLPRHLTNVGYEELLFGFLYVTWGQKGS